MDLSKIPAEMVDKFYEMDPQTDDVFRDGTFLRDGMIVLLEAYQTRKSIHDLDSVEDWRTAKTLNLWCMVQDIRIDERNRDVSFVGVYHDGIKRRRSHGLSTGWIVKIDSVPELLLTDEDHHCVDCMLIPDDKVVCIKPNCSCHGKNQTCDHPIDLYAPHCTTVGCPNYAGLFRPGLPMASIRIIDNDLEPKGFGD